MRRRNFLSVLSGAAAWPLSARAQQPAMPLIGFLSSRSPGESSGMVAGFRQGLSEAGFVEGRNLAIAFRWAEGRYEQLPPLAAELVGLQVRVIVTQGGTPSALAAKAATSTIPIVFTSVTDPVGTGLVASFNRPSGNVTGISLFTAAIEAKRLELLHEMVPKATVVGLLVNPNSPIAETNTRATEAAARALQLELHVLRAGNEQEIDAAFEGLVRHRVAAFAVSADAFFSTRRDQLVRLAARYALPAIYEFRDFVAAGGLMSYGASFADNNRKAGVYAGRILKGDKPADLPVEQPTKFELAINLRAAKALGLDVPPTLLARADEVIE
jgi:putative ABC transport system substrate-binding protein